MPTDKTKLTDKIKFPNKTKSKKITSLDKKLLLLKQENNHIKKCLIFQDEFIEDLENKLSKTVESTKILEIQCQKYKSESGEHLFLCFLMFILFGILLYDNETFCLGECINNYEMY